MQQLGLGLGLAPLKLKLKLGVFVPVPVPVPVPLLEQSLVLACWQLLVLRSAAAVVQPPSAAAALWAAFAFVAALLSPAHHQLLLSQSLAATLPHAHAKNASGASAVGRVQLFACQSGWVVLLSVPCRLVDATLQLLGVPDCSASEQVLVGAPAPPSAL